MELTPPRLVEPPKRATGTNADEPERTPASMPSADASLRPASPARTGPASSSGSEADPIPEAGTGTATSDSSTSDTATSDTATSDAIAADTAPSPAAEPTAEPKPTTDAATDTATEAVAAGPAARARRGAADAKSASSKKSPAAKKSAAPKKATTPREKTNISGGEGTTKGAGKTSATTPTKAASPKATSAKAPSNRTAAATTRPAAEAARGASTLAAVPPPEDGARLVGDNEAAPVVSRLKAASAAETLEPQSPASVPAVAADVSTSARGVVPMLGRIPVIDVQPRVAHGAWPARAVPGEAFTVTATVFREGHDAVACDVVLTDPSGGRREPVRMRPLDDGSDRWIADVAPDSEGAWTYAVEAWSDPLATWRHRAEVKVPAGIDAELELTEGALLLAEAAGGVPEGEGRAKVEAAAEALREAAHPPTDRLHAVLSSDAWAILHGFPLRQLVTSSAPLELRVERNRALYGSWYEFFPRSEGVVVDPTGATPPRSGTFRTAAERLPAIAGMGFDVVYLPPIHPIGRAFRKGANNSLTPLEHEPGSPWAIGGPEGGHDAIHPDLGTFEDFDAFVARARELGMEVALDFALQASPDHPWVREHPEWFVHRADGTIAYAENPPKKYQDIYPIAFDEDPEGLFVECERLLRHWMSHGVRIFRVDNPHTKPVMFWERLIATINATDPDVIFLAEAFTRPAMMRTLAMVGFQQSYTYFTWRNTKEELESYLRELSQETAAFMRPNFFVNTPDILNEYLQHGGPAAFRIRATLGAMLSPSWGVYSGFELYESTPVRPGSEEYLDSEKYQYRPRDWDAALWEHRTLAPYITSLNRLRREHPALRQLRNLRLHYADNDGILVFSKRAPDLGPSGSGPVTTSTVTASRVTTGGVTTGDARGGRDTVLVVVTLDPHRVREATIRLDLPELGLDWHESFEAHDMITGATFRWGEHNYVRLDPAYEVAHILTVRRSVP